MKFSSFSKVLLRLPSQSLKNIYSHDKFISNSLFQEGLYLSSNDFWTKLKELNSRSDKISKTLLKYWIRSCSRATPYATFAGVTLASVSNRTKLILSDCHRKYTRLDSYVIFQLIEVLAKDVEIRNKLRFYPNNSIYLMPGECRYADYVVKPHGREYYLCTVSRSRYLDKILEYVHGGKRIEEIVLKVGRSEKPSTDMAEFIDKMIDARILVSELDLCITGKEPFDRLIEQLDALSVASDIVSLFKEIQLILRKSNKNIFDYCKIEKLLKKTNLIDQLPKDVFQTDLFLTGTTLELQKELIDDIVAQCNDLSALSREYYNSDLEKFKNQFFKKFNESEIPLTIALDSDIGIGYGNTLNNSVGGGDLIDDLLISTDKTNFESFDYIQKFTLQKYSESLKNQSHCIEIFDHELEELKRSDVVFPRTTAVFGNLLRKNGEFSKDHYLFNLISFGGPCGANLLSRFTLGNEEISQFAKEIIDFEEKTNTTTVYAEIAYLSEARDGNIVLRSLLRNYEIPYLANSGIDPDFQIPVEDILVRVENGHIILRSKKHNIRILPRLTSVHNYNNKSLPIYKLLCDLQMQGMYHSCVWDWGNLESLEFLPRVVYKNIILKRARWVLKETDFKLLEGNNIYALFLEVRKKKGLPQKVAYIQGDNELLIDLDVQEHLEILQKVISKDKKIILEEFLFEESNCIVENQHGEPFINEVVIPVCSNTEDTALQGMKYSSENYSNQNFAPGSEWLYIKIYTGPRYSETILKSLSAFLLQGRKKGIFEKFFFVRYYDPLPHLRIRFYNTDAKKNIRIQNVISDYCKPLIDARIISDVVISNYCRELDRYGHDLIEETEMLFYGDSLSVIEFINDVHRANSNRMRLLFAIKSIDALLNDFKFSLSDKYSLLKAKQKSYFDEFGGTPHLLKQLNQKFRNLGAEIREFMKDIEKFSAPHTILKKRSELNEIEIAKILSRVNDRERLIKLVSYYIHMLTIRIFIAQQRKYELVIYHCLERYYYSILEREKSLSLRTNID